MQPAIDTPEVRALTELAEQWIDDLGCHDRRQAARQRSSEVGAVLIGYRELRTAMRAGPTADEARQRGERRGRLARLEQVEHVAAVTGGLDLAVHVLDGGVEPCGAGDLDAAP